MDPLSIATGCIGLVKTIGSTSISIHAFVRTCREARSDLDRVSRELHSLQTVLELIQEDATDEAKPFPPTLAQHVSGIVSNCTSVVEDVQSCITKYGDGKLMTKMSWAMAGHGDMEKLRSSLEAHKSALELALDMLALSLTKEIKNDTTEIRNETAAIKDDTTQILQEIARLQARLPDNTGTPNDFLLQRFLEEMTTYTEQELDTTLIGGENNWRNSRDLSFVEENEEILAESNEAAVNFSANNSLLVAPAPPAKIPLSMAHHTYPSRPKSAVAPKPNLNTFYASQFDSEPEFQSPPSPVPNQWGYLSYSGVHGQSYERPYEHSYGQPAVSQGGPASSVPHTLTGGQQSQEIEVVAGERSSDIGQNDDQRRYIEETSHASYMGNLVIDYPLPENVLSTIPHGVRDEFTHVRFTAVTCPAQYFTNRNYVLRNRLFAKTRDIRIVIFFLLNPAEGAHDFARRWNLIARAIDMVNVRTRETSDVRAWKRIVVHFHGPPNWKGVDPDVAQMLDQMIVKSRMDTVVNVLDNETLEPPYSEDSPTLRGEKVHATVREYTTQVHPCAGRMLDGSRGLEIGCPVQVIATAAGVDMDVSIDSYSDWMHAIGQQLKPELVVDMTDDVRSTNPDFLYKLWVNEHRLVTQKRWKSNLHEITLKDLLDQLSKSNLRKSVSKFARNFLS